MNLPRKQRKQGTIANLPASQRAKVDGWLLKNFLYRTIKRRMAAEMGVQISDSALGAYWQKMTAQKLAAGGNTAAETMAGAEIVIRFESPGEMKLFVRPLPAPEREARFKRGRRQRE